MDIMHIDKVFADIKNKQKKQRKQTFTHASGYGFLIKM